MTLSPGIKHTGLLDTNSPRLNQPTNLHETENLHKSVELAGSGHHPSNASD